MALVALFAIGLSLPPVVFAEASVCADTQQAQPLAHVGKTLRVATLNIAHGRGTSLNQMLIGTRAIERNLDAAARLISESRIDVVALQELDGSSLWSGCFDHAPRLQQGTSFSCAITGIHAETWLYRFGTGLLSRVPLVDARVRHFEPTPPTTTKGFVAGTLRWNLPSGEYGVRVVSVHLDFSRKQARRRQLDALIAAIKNSPVPVILMGDFNEQWYAADSVVRRLVDDAGLVAFRPESDQLSTYKAKRLDWILLSPSLEFVDYEVVQQPVSDHRLVTAEVRWKAHS